jgi:hypothetical protein
MSGMMRALSTSSRPGSAATSPRRLELEEGSSAKPSLSTAAAAKPPADEECCVCVAVNIRPLVDGEIAEGCAEILAVDRTQVLGLFLLRASYARGGGGVAIRQGQCGTRDVAAAWPSGRAARQTRRRRRRRCVAFPRPHRPPPQTKTNNTLSAHNKKKHEKVSAGPQHAFTYDHVFGGAGGRPLAALYVSCVAPLVAGLFRGYNATVFAYGQTGSGKTYTMGSAFAPGAGAGGAGGGGPRVAGVIPAAVAEIFERIDAARDAVQATVRVSFVEINKVRGLFVGVLTSVFLLDAPSF